MTDLSALTATRKRLMAARQHIHAALLCLSFCMPVSLIQASSLDPQAYHRAKQVADATSWAQPRTSNGHSHPLGIQTLSIEIQESKSNQASSVLRVYQYHYDLMQARLLVVDADTARVLKSQAINSVHLPLNQAEIDYASMLLQAHAPIVQRLRDEQIKRGHLAFALVSDLDVKASIYEPLDPAHECYQQRCALMSLFDDTRTVFSAEPVVNLQRERVGLLGKP